MSSADDEGVVMNTFSGLYTVERRLHRIYELELPRPVSLPQLGAFLLVLPAVGLLWHVVQVSFTIERSFLWVGPPALAAWALNRPLAEGRRPLAWLCTQVRHRLEPAVLDRLRRREEPDRMRVVARIQEPRAGLRCRALAALGSARSSARRGMS